MVTLDRIRLTGLLKENPAICRVFPFLGTGRLVVACITRASRNSESSSAEGDKTKRPSARTARLGQIAAVFRRRSFGSERRLLTEAVIVAARSSGAAKAGTEQKRPHRSLRDAFDRFPCSARGFSQALLACSVGLALSRQQGVSP
jgi:hypothetical protein